MKSIDDAIGEAWNIQAGRRVYPMNFGTSDIAGIRQALEDAGYIIMRRRWYHFWRRGYEMARNG